MLFRSLQIPIGQEYSTDEIFMLSPEIAKKYATVTRPTKLRDLKELQEMKLLGKVGRKYIANTNILKSMMPDKRAMKRQASIQFSKREKMRDRLIII